MKLSEAIDRLQAGDTVWVKATVDRINNEGKYIRVMPNASSVYLDGHDEISLTEPQAEKVEVPEFVAEWIEYAKKKGHTVIQSGNPWDLYGAEWSKADVWINQNQDIFARAFMDGYTIQPKRWVVTTTDSDTCYLKRFRMGKECLDGDISKVWVGELGWAFTFTDKSKAEAVAVLVEGTVEEV